MYKKEAGIRRVVEWRVGQSAHAPTTEQLCPSKLWVIAHLRRIKSITGLSPGGRFYVAVRALLYCLLSERRPQISPHIHLEVTLEGPLMNTSYVIANWIFTPVFSLLGCETFSRSRLLSHSKTHTRLLLVIKSAPSHKSLLLCCWFINTMLQKSPAPQEQLRAETLWREN